VSEKFEDTNWIIQCRKSKKDRQRSGERRKTKDNYLQNTTQKATDRATRSHYKPGGGPLEGKINMASATSGTGTANPTMASATSGTGTANPTMASATSGTGTANWKG
jgi:hypothetical protein